MNSTTLTHCYTIWSFLALVIHSCLLKYELRECVIVLDLFLEPNEGVVIAVVHRDNKRVEPVLNAIISASQIWQMRKYVLSQVPQSLVTMVASPHSVVQSDVLSHPKSGHRRPHPI